MNKPTNTMNGEIKSSELFVNDSEVARDRNASVTMPITTNPTAAAR